MPHPLDDEDTRARFEEIRATLIRLEARTETNCEVTIDNQRRIDQLTFKFNQLQEDYAPYLHEYMGRRQGDRGLRDEIKALIDERKASGIVASGARWLVGLAVALMALWASWTQIHK